MKIALAALSAMEQQPAKLGVRDGRLMPCPNLPNCVCSYAENPQHAIEPLRFSGSAREAMKKLERLVASQSRTNVVTIEDDYLHVEYTSAVFRFTDDVEFLLDEGQSVIHMRSASRIGFADLGTNRNRLEKIRAAFEETS